MTALRYRSRYPTLRPILHTAILSNICIIVAQSIWFYFNVSGIEIPYPSLADFFFLLFYPTNAYLLLCLTRHTQPPWTLSTWSTLLLLILVFGGLIFVFLSTNLDFSLSLPVLILNLTYPLCDAILAALGVTLLRHQPTLGYRYLFLFVFAYIFIAIADVIFSLHSTGGLYWNGNFVDLIYATSYFILALGVYYFPALTATAASDNAPSIPPVAP